MHSKAINVILAYVSMLYFCEILLQNVFVSKILGRKVRGAKCGAQNVGRKVWGAKCGGAMYGCKVWGRKEWGRKVGKPK